MEIKSEKKFDTINVTDIDIQFPGNLQEFTLRDGLDSYSVNPACEGDAISMTAGDVLTMHLVQGTLRFNLVHAHWMAIRHRTLRVEVSAAPSAE